ncbi:MAG: V-type ATPase subunit [Coriobacteriia bacterium]|nr:V-type ATPase subunit [Coriobacteriia bacterium]
MSEAVVTAGNRAVPESDEGYANARLRGMRSHLLPLSFYERLIEAPDLNQVVKELMDTSYSGDLEDQLVHGRTAAVIDEALKHNMIRAYRKVLKFLHPNARMLLSTLLGRWDVFNLKTILRGAHNHVAFDDVKSSFFPVGYLSAEELEALSKLDDVRVIIDTMAMWDYPYAAPLRRAYPEFSKSNDLAPLELALDRQYAEWAASRLIGEAPDVDVARRILGMQIDTLNLVMVFRLLKADVESIDASGYYLEGGRVIRKEQFLELARLSDVDEVLDRLKSTAYAEALDAAALRYLENASIPVFERALEDLLMRRALLSGVRDPHGVGVAIAYLFGKQNEVTNVRIIVKGKAVGMPADRVREELILV